MQSKVLKIDGMTCVNCENRIERKLKNTKGITGAKVSYSSGTAHITYDETLIGIEKIIMTVERLDYKVVKTTDQKSSSGSDITRVLGVAVILLALYLIISQFGCFQHFQCIPAGNREHRGMECCS